MVQGSKGEDISFRQVSKGRECSLVVVQRRNAVIVRIRLNAESRTIAGGIERGRAAGPLRKMARGLRAHLVSDNNDLFSLLSVFKIKDFLTLVKMLSKSSGIP